MFVLNYINACNHELEQQQCWGGGLAQPAQSRGCHSTLEHSNSKQGMLYLVLEGVLHGVGAYLWVYNWRGYKL
jgi:hypothetical protein